MNDELLARLVTELQGVRKELAGIRQAQVKSGWIAGLPHYIGVVLVFLFAIAMLVFFYFAVFQR